MTETYTFNAYQRILPKSVVVIFRIILTNFYANVPCFSRSEIKSFDAYSHELCCTWVLRLPFSAALYLLLNVRYWNMKYQQSFTIFYRFKALFSSLINLKRQLSSLPQFFTSVLYLLFYAFYLLFYAEVLSRTSLLFPNYLNSPWLSRNLSTR